MDRPGTPPSELSPADLDNGSGDMRLRLSAGHNPWSIIQLVVSIALRMILTPLEHTFFRPVIIFWGGQRGLVPRPASAIGIAVLHLTSSAARRQPPSKWCCSDCTQPSSLLFLTCGLSKCCFSGGTRGAEQSISMTLIWSRYQMNRPTRPLCYNI